MAGEYDFSKASTTASALTDPTIAAINGINGINWNDTTALTPITALAPNPFRTDTASAPGAVAGAAGAAVDPNRGFGLNIPTLQLGLGALNSIGGLYAAFQSQALAKKQFQFTKDAYNQNLTNSIQSYNTALDDKARSRAVMEGQTAAERDAYIAKNSLKKV